MKKQWIGALVAGIAGFSARAHFGDRYGLGLDAISSARTLASRCQYNVFAAYYNPALLGCTGDAAVEISYVHTADFFSKINGVVTSSNTYPTKTAPYSASGSISVDYPNHHAVQLGTHFPILPKISWLKEHHLQIGLSAHVNVNHLMSLDSGFAYSPSYILYENRDQRFFATAGAGLEAIREWLWVGAAADFYMTAGTQTYFFLNATSSLGGIAVDVDPAFSAIVGGRWRLWPDTALFMSLVYHQRSDQTIHFNALTDLSFGPSDSIPFIFGAIPSLYSEPHRLTWSAAYEPTGWSVETGVDVTWWRSMMTPRVLLDFDTVGADTPTPANQWKSVVLSYHVAGSFNFKPWDFSMGLAHEPSAITSGTGPEAELDADKWALGLGVKYAVESWNTTFGLSYQGQFLVKENVTRANSQYLGYPGFSVGGSVHAAELGMQTHW